METNNVKVMNSALQLIGITISFLIIAAVIRLGWNILIEPCCPEAMITFKQGMGASLLLLMLQAMYRVGRQS